MGIQSLQDEWQAAGVDEGDVLLVHSSIKRTILRLKREDKAFGPADILQSFLEAIGPGGTLILPAFNFDFTKGSPFDIRATPSHMGALTEIARQTPGAVRTGHPMYSFIVLGKEANRFAAIDNKSGYDAHSPFALLRTLDGKIAVLDLPDQKSMTFYHHVEEMHDVLYRYHKDFSAPYTDVTGETSDRTYSIYVRNLEEGVLTHVDPAGELMWQAGLYKGCRPSEGCGLRTIKARAMYDFVSGIITAGNAENILYKKEKTSAS